MSMFSRAYRSLSRITIEAADCKLNYQNLNGHLTIFVEPIDPVFPIGNRDPLIGQTSGQNTTRPNDRIATDRNNSQPSTSYAQQNTMIADTTHRSPHITTHRSPDIPSQIVEPLILQPSTIPSTNNPSPVPTEYDEDNYPQADESESENEINEEQNTAQNAAPTPDPIHMPKTEPKEDIPHNENENENENENDRPITPDINNPIPNDTEFPNPNYVIPEETPQNDQPQPGPSTSDSNINSTLANFIESPGFQDTMKRMTLQVGESTFNRIAKHPQLVKQWILQVVHKFPGLLDDVTDHTVAFVDTDRGQVRITQPMPSQNPSQNPQPLDQQDHDISQVREVAPQPPPTIQQQEENNDTHTIPSSSSPTHISSENSDEENDCYIAKISPGPKTKSLKRRAPPPDGPTPQVILKKIPHKQGTRAYTITQTSDIGQITTTTIKAEIHGQPQNTDNTGPEQNNTPKRPRIQDNTPQPSTSTETATTQNKDKKHRKHKKDKKKDKDN